jgi:hypothetical protein
VFNEDGEEEMILVSPPPEHPPARPPPAIPDDVDVDDDVIFLPQPTDRPPANPLPTYPYLDIDFCDLGTTDRGASPVKRKLIRLRTLDPRQYFQVCRMYREYRKRISEAIHWSNMADKIEFQYPSVPNQEVEANEHRAYAREQSDLAIILSTRITEFLDRVSPEGPLPLELFDIPIRHSSSPELLRLNPFPPPPPLPLPPPSPRQLLAPKYPKPKHYESRYTSAPVPRPESLFRSPSSPRRPKRKQKAKANHSTAPL